MKTVTGKKFRLPDRSRAGAEGFSVAEAFAEGV